MVSDSHSAPSELSVEIDDTVVVVVNVVVDVVVVNVVVDVVVVNVVVVVVVNAVVVNVVVVIVVFLYFEIQKFPPAWLHSCKTTRRLNLKG